MQRTLINTHVHVPGHIKAGALFDLRLSGLNPLEQSRPAVSSGGFKTSALSHTQPPKEPRVMLTCEVFLNTLAAAGPRTSVPVVKMAVQKGGRKSQSERTSEVSRASQAFHSSLIILFFNFCGVFFKLQQKQEVSAAAGCPHKPKTKEEERKRAQI